MKFGIASFSFHRLLAAGKQDMLQYIADSKALGASTLEPWNAHLAAAQDDEAVIKAGRDPEHARLAVPSDTYLAQIKAAAEDAGLVFGCIAVDGAHIYEPEPEQRQHNRDIACRWLDVAEKLDAAQLRIDAGGPPEMPDAVFEIIVAGYDDLIARARDKGIEILVENHWGPTPNPDHLLKLLDAVDGLGLLLDTNNFIAERREEGWERCAPYARAVHVKTFEFDAEGNDPTVDIPRAVRLIAEAGYAGSWGIESVPRDGDEYGAVEKTAALIERSLAQSVSH